MKKLLEKSFLLKLCVVIFLITITAQIAVSQSFRTSSYWRQFRQELTFGIGGSNFLGELGGADQLGTNFIKDLEPSMTRYVLNVGYRYFTWRNHSIKGSMYVGSISGDDRTTLEPFRNTRNLHFKSFIIENSALYEFHPITEKMGSRYKIRGRKKGKKFPVGISLFAGVGFIYFNPKARLYDLASDTYSKEWYKLQPLGTEGQGLEGMPKPYSRLALAFPVGISFRYSLQTKWKLSMELGMRKTTTDYLDDVSGVYYPSHDLRAEKGDLTADLADPNRRLLGDGAWNSFSSFSMLPEQRPRRGDNTDKDSYMFGSVSLCYKMTKRRGKFRRIRSRSAIPSF